MQGKPIYAVGLDAGSNFTRFAIGVLEQSGLRVIGIGAAESQGWVKGRIADQRAASDSILRAVRDAEAAAQITVESAVAGMGGSTVRGANSRAAIEVGRKREIEHRDVNRVIEHSSRVQLHEDRMLLQACLQDFLVDDHPGHRDPRGMIASRIEANMHLITAPVLEHDSLVTASTRHT
jgi:cell division protein FtsA